MSGRGRVQTVVGKIGNRSFTPPDFLYLKKGEFFPPERIVCLNVYCSFSSKGLPLNNDVFWHWAAIIRHFFFADNETGRES